MWSLLPVAACVFAAGIAIGNWLASFGASGLPLAGAAAVGLVATILSRGVSPLLVPSALWTLLALGCVAGHSAETAALRLMGSEPATEGAERIYWLAVTSGVRPAEVGGMLDARLLAVGELGRAGRGPGPWRRMDGRVRVVGAAASWLPVAGDRLFVRGRVRPPGRRLHRFAYDPLHAATMRRQPATLLATGEPALERAGSGLRAALDRRRITLERGLRSRIAGPASGPLIAMTTGSKAALDPAMRQSFARAGVAHVLAVSGLHVMFVCWALYRCLNWLWRRWPYLTQRVPSQQAAALASIPSVWVYVLGTGAPASAARAGVMATVVLVSMASLRRPSALHALAAAVIGMLAYQPRWLFDLGFQLSVSATAGLVLHAAAHAAARRRRMAERADAPSLLVRLVAMIGGSVSASAVATAATGPALLWHFGSVPLAGTWANLLVVPPLALGALPVALLSGLADLLGLRALADLLAPLAAGLARVGLFALDAVTALGVPELVWGRPSVAGLIGWLVVAVVVIAWPLIWASRRVPWGALLIGSLALALDLPPSVLPPAETRLHAIPVGQGDCTLVETQAGTLLIDAGGARERLVGERLVLPYLRGLGYHRVDVVAVTHGDLDHAGGVIDILHAIQPTELWTGDVDARRTVDRALLHEAARLRIPHRTLHRTHAGARFGDTRIEVLPSDRVEASNDGSLVLRVCRRSICALLTGDAEGPREASLAAGAHPLRAQYFKLGHHGSRTSSSDALLDRVRPQVAVAHVGRENRFGFPHAEVVARLARRGVALHRTDQGRAVIWATDGDVSWIEPDRALHWFRTTPDDLAARLW